MIWLTRPPYLRWLAAAAIVVASAAVDLAGRATEPVPFAAADLPRGTQLEAAAIEWRDVPVGMLEAAEISGHTRHPVATGDPITASNVTPDGRITIGWWSVAVDLPASATTGQPVRLVGTNPEFSVEGIVAELGERSTFGVGGAGLVAVPPEFADRVARALASGQLVVLLGF